MRFRLRHRTEYRYRQPASESVGELRVCPPETPAQTILSRALTLEPAAPVSHYRDAFGNTVECFTLPFRHPKLAVTLDAEVETRLWTPPEDSLAVPVGEARQIFNSQVVDLHEFLRPTARVPLGRELAGLRRPNFFRAARPLGEALRELNEWIHATFAYRPGVTDVSTPLQTVIEKQAGVCQDFAHLMLALVRSSGLAARYVSGYIEAYDPTLPGAELVGAAASHAWVEAYLPGGHWWGLDPTNRQTAGERHVLLATGRDYGDAAPLRGTYKGASDQSLRVMVSLKRGQPSLPRRAAPRPPRAAKAPAHR